MGELSLLAADGRHPFGKTPRPSMYTINHHRGRPIGNFFNGVAARSPRGISSHTRITVVAFGQDQAQLAAQQHHFPQRAPKAMSPLYIEEIHMLEGLEDEELERYLDKNPRIVFKIDVVETT